MFRPCIDLHEGKVKQLVGGTLSDDGTGLKTNFVSERSSAWYAELYKRDQLAGGHVIMLGPGNEKAAFDALGAYPGGLQVGGGISIQNAAQFLDAGASHVIVTSAMFQNGILDRSGLRELSRAIGRARLVLDLSCRKRGNTYWVVTNRWQTFTDLSLSGAAFQELAEYGAEFLIHAVDVEGLCQGIDEELVEKVSQWSPIPATYAGGAKSLRDLERVAEISAGRVDLTIGSALDIFGGTGVRYADVVAFNRSSRDRLNTVKAHSTGRGSV